MITPTATRGGELNPPQIKIILSVSEVLLISTSGRAGELECVKYISWNIALISTYITNCFGYVWRVSSVMGLLHAYAIVKLLTNPHMHNKAG